MKTAPKNQTLFEVFKELDAMPFAVDINYNIAIRDYAERSRILAQSLETGINILNIVKPIFQEALEELPKTRFKEGYFSSNEYQTMITDLSQLVNTHSLMHDHYNVLEKRGILLFKLNPVKAFLQACDANTQRGFVKDTLKEEESSQTIREIKFLNERIDDIYSEHTRRRV
ncbi:MAG: hypothetical protein OEV42_17345 [Deltaproteobacteria bacterium]|nr:hypothetical protein [Deltaproteobacteria bacterium]